MRKNARFTHDTTNFGHDVRGKRFRTHETKNIEYKSNWRDKHLKYICGFANANGGKIYTLALKMMPLTIGSLLAHLKHIASSIKRYLSNRIYSSRHFGF